MNKTINKFLLTADKFMPELDLKRPGFTYSACGPFTKHCERIRKFRETENLKQSCRNELDKARLAHYAAYSDSKVLLKELFQTRFIKIELLKLIEILTMIDVKER